MKKWRVQLIEDRRRITVERRPWFIPFWMLVHSYSCYFQIHEQDRNAWYFDTEVEAIAFMNDLKRDCKIGCR